MGASDDRLFELASRNRLLAVGMLQQLTPDQWATASLCKAWTVREVAAHLVPAANTGWGQLAAELVRHRLDFDRMADHAARERARQPTDDIIAALRAGACTRMRPPGIGAAGPMTDTAVHLRDMAIPLGLPVTADPESWLAALEFLVSRPARRGFVPKGRLEGLRLEATDWSWTWGSGPYLVQGPVEDLAMAVAGRPCCIARLHGPGVAMLAARA